MNNLTVIVPFYNEEKYLYASVQRLLAEKIFEKIILVNDLSNDNSFEIAQDLSNNYEQIHVISTSNQIGKGNAIREALEHTNTSHVIVHDADLEYFPEDITEMYQIATNNKDSLILGSRTIGDKKRTNLYMKTFYAQKIYASISSNLNIDNT